MTDGIHAAGLSEDEDATLNRLIKQLDKHALRNGQRSLYYDGEKYAQFASSIMPDSYRELRLVLGWSAKAVDTLANRCNLDGFVWPDGDLGDIGASEVWEDNVLDSTLATARTASLTYGVAFLVVNRGESGEPPALVHALSAENATGEWDGRLRQLRNLLVIEERESHGRPTGVTLYMLNETITIGLDGKRWAVEERVRHPYGVPAQPLVYRPEPTRRDFGRSRITRVVMSLQDSAVRTLMRMEGHLDAYSWPELFLLGADERVFTDVNGNPLNRWQIMLGRIKTIPDDESLSSPRADVKQFAASNPEPHLLALRQVAQLFAGETSIPLTSLGVSDMSNPTSADSYIASREDLIAEAEHSMTNWGPALRRTQQLALTVANGLDETPQSWHSIDCDWRSPLYLSRAAMADAGLKQVAAFPWLAETEVGLELVGLRPAQITRALAERRRNSGMTAALRILDDAV